MFAMTFVTFWRHSLVLRMVGIRYAAGMKHQSWIERITGNFIELTDRSQWEVETADSTQLVYWFPGNKVEAEDLGDHAHITHLRTGKTVRAKRARGK